MESTSRNRREDSMSKAEQDQRVSIEKSEYLAWHDFLIQLYKERESCQLSEAVCRKYDRLLAHLSGERCPARKYKI